MQHSWTEELLLRLPRKRPINQDKVIIQEKDPPNGQTGDLKREAPADQKVRAEIIKETANSAGRIRKSIAICLFNSYFCESC